MSSSDGDKLVPLDVDLDSFNVCEFSEIMLFLNQIRNWTKELYSYIKYLENKIDSENGNLNMLSAYLLKKIIISFPNLVDTIISYALVSKFPLTFIKVLIDNNCTFYKNIFRSKFEKQMLSYDDSLTIMAYLTNNNLCFHKSLLKFFKDVIPVDILEVIFSGNNIIFSKHPGKKALFDLNVSSPQIFSCDKTLKLEQSLSFRNERIFKQKLQIKKCDIIKLKKMMKYTKNMLNK